MYHTNSKPAKGMPEALVAGNEVLAWHQQTPMFPLWHQAMLAFCCSKAKTNCAQVTQHMGNQVCNSAKKKYKNQFLVYKLKGIT